MEIVHNAIGIFGTLLIIYAYFLLQTGRIESESFKYSLLNLIGAGAVIFSLIFDFNFASFLVESFWVLISLIGIYRNLARPDQRH